MSHPSDAELAQSQGDLLDNADKRVEQFEREHAKGGGK